jgi:hypothetical protein
MKLSQVSTGILLVTSLAAVVITLVAINHYQQQPKPEPTVPVSQLVREREAAYRHGSDAARTLQDQVDANSKRLTELESQKVALCAQLKQARLANTACTYSE